MTIKELKERKKELGYTNHMISELSGVPLGTVQKIFAGITTAPRYETLQALEKSLTPDDYFYKHSGIGSIIKESSAEYSFTKHNLKDYYALPEDCRAEMIDGTFYDMASPTVEHQAIIMYLAHALTDHVQKNKGNCLTFTAPLDVILDEDDNTVVQPDLFVLCDREKITKNCIIGAPDLVIEVLSPATRKKDMRLKYYKYGEAGVREYWIVDPEHRNVLVYDLEQDTVPAIYGFEDEIPVLIWDRQCRISMKDMAACLLSVSSDHSIQSPAQPSPGPDCR